MAIVYAQHATAGEYHLETCFVDGTWEWTAKAIRNKKLPEFSGSEAKLDVAKRSAAKSIGLAVEANWQSIGPPVELPD